MFFEQAETRPCCGAKCHWLQCHVTCSPGISPGGHTEVVGHLLEAHGDVNQGKHDNMTPLYIASQNHHMPVFHMLLEARADVNAQNHNGATALFVSCQSLGFIFGRKGFGSGQGQVDQTGVSLCTHFNLTSTHEDTEFASP